MTRRDAIAAPVIRCRPRDAERLSDGLAPAERLEDLVDRHADEVDSHPVRKQGAREREFLTAELRGQNTLRANADLLSKTEAAMAEELLLEIARRLAIIRKELKLSQDEIGEYLHIGRSRWLNWERAQHFPSLVIMVRLCEYTGLTFDYIFRGLHGGLPQTLSVRLAIREQGGDPDAPEFQGVRAKRARRAKTDG